MAAKTNKTFGELVVGDHIWELNKNSDGIHKREILSKREIGVGNIGFLVQEKNCQTLVVVRNVDVYNHITVCGTESVGCVFTTNEAAMLEHKIAVLEIAAKKTQDKIKELRKELEKITKL